MVKVECDRFLLRNKLAYFQSKRDDFVTIASVALGPI
jgi:hypothetical protein